MTLLDALAQAVSKATPQHIDTAQYHHEGELLDCPWCNGDGSLEADTFTNYDDCALGVQFFGIGPEHKNAQAYFRLCSPSNISALIAVARATKEYMDDDGGKSFWALHDKLRDALAALDVEITP